MAKAIETGRAPRAGYHQTLHVLEAMEAFETSSKRRSAVDLESVFSRENPMVAHPVTGILQ
ncbi:hypothetical protein D3C81_1991310 [compost metagenome]